VGDSVVAPAGHSGMTVGVIGRRPAAVKPAKPEPHTPENVGQARLTCGQPPSRAPFTQVSPKREDVSSSARFLEFIFVR
jgi:hypothetical protein